MKKLFCLLLALLMLGVLWLPASAGEESGERLRGDINGDGKVNPTDYAMLKRMVLRTYTGTDFQQAGADVSQDGRVNAIDYAMLKRVVLGTYSFDGSSDFPFYIDINITPVDDPDAYISNGVIISKLRVMENFGGNAESGAATAVKLNNFKKAVGDGVEVYVLACPLASAFYAPVKYSGAITRHIDCFTALRDGLEGVKYVDALGALSLHVDEPIYARTDHHWNALGAYYAAQELARIAKLPFDDLSTFKEYSTDGYLGSLYYHTQDPTIRANPETFTWYEPTRSYEAVYYSVDYLNNPIYGNTLFAPAGGYIKFIYGDSYTTHIKANNGTGRKLLMFKDSYGNALAPFLVSSFDEVYIADFRYFKYGAKKFIADKGITDVCFSLCAFAVASTARNYIDYVQ
ncbi:MAG: hypothetical protein J5925_01390 [Clostridia bacterium]|nr:hypothetical protein [Clostridia bacterium]